MRRYDDPVETRMGQVSGMEGPEQFLWRGRLWKVRAVLAHWVETGPWWQSGGVRAVIGSEDQPDVAGTVATLTSPDLLAEREVWRVEATPRGRGVTTPDDPAGRPGFGVFDLTFSWSTGGWRLTGCVD